MAAFAAHELNHLGQHLVENGLLVTRDVDAGSGDPDVAMTLHHLQMLRSRTN
jgi:hypothetical protein